MPAPAPPPHDEDDDRARVTAAIAASLAAIEGRPSDATDRPTRRATAVIQAIQAHRRPGSGTA